MIEGKAGAVSTYAKTKEQVKEEMSLLAEELAAPGFVYARKTNNADLQGILDVSYSEIRYADDQSAYRMASAVHSALADELTNLGVYMVNQENLDELLGLTEEYKARLENTSSEDSVARTKQLKVLFRKTSEHLKNETDKLMLRVKRKEPVIYDAYRQARVIVDLGRSRKRTESDEFEA